MPPMGDTDTPTSSEPNEKVPFKRDLESVTKFWANVKKDATEFGKSRGTVEGNKRWVMLQHLQSDVGKMLNGKVGLVMKEEPNDEGRYQVKVDDDRPTIKLLKPTNIQTIPNEDLVQVYRIPCDGEKGETHELLLYPKTHSIFSGCTPMGNSPAMALCGFPLMIKKTSPRKQLNTQADYDNQWTTYMMIEPISGFAPMEWQSMIGPSLVFRPDASDISADDMDVVNQFLNDLLDQFGDPPFDSRTWLNPKYFLNYVKRIKDERAINEMGSNLEGLTLLET